MSIEKTISQYFSKILDDFDKLHNKSIKDVLPHNSKLKDGSWFYDKNSNTNKEHLLFNLYHEGKISPKSTDICFNTRIFLQKFSKIYNKQIYNAYFSLLRPSGIISLNKFKQQHITKNEKLEQDKNCFILGLLVEDPAKTCLILNGNKNYIRQMKLIRFDDKRQFGEFNLSNYDRLVLYIRLY